MLKRIVLPALLACGIAIPPCEGASDQPCELAPDELAKLLLYAPQPFYPFEARRSKLGGEGIFQLDVDRGGAVNSVKVYKSTRTKLIDIPTMITLKAWRLRPLPRGCKGVLVHIDFKPTPW